MTWIIGLAIQAIMALSAVKKADEMKEDLTKWKSQVFKILKPAMFFMGGFIVINAVKSAFLEAKVSKQWIRILDEIAVERGFNNL